MMAKFEFAKRRAVLEFPNSKYEIDVDGAALARLTKTAEWLVSEGERLMALSEKKDIGDTEANRLIGEATSGIMQRIDDFLGDGAAKAILSGRLEAPKNILYNDALDVLKFIMKEIKAAYMTDELKR